VGFRREGLVGRIAPGIVAGLATLLFFKIDQITFMQPLHSGTSAFNYSMIIVMFYVLFVMNFMAGFRRQYESSITYITFMVVYDLATDGLVTILFAGISFVSLIIGRAVLKAWNSIQG
jgi:hypothetical protein